MAKTVKRVEDNLVVRNATLAFRNFRGKESQFNPPGRMNFCIFFDPEMGTQLEKDGWAIRWRNPDNDEEVPLPFLSVAVSYDQFPPKVVQITDRGKVYLDAETIGTLDYAEIVKADLIVRPYNWAVGGNHGVKAYLKELYVTIFQSELAMEYSDIPDIPTATIEAPWQNEPPL